MAITAGTTVAGGLFKYGEYEMSDDLRLAEPAP
jgi:hypothetical protein